MLEQLDSILGRGHGREELVSDAADAPNSTSLERVRKWILHYNIQHLYGPERVVYGPDELVVFCLVRDGRPYVRSFIEHYLALGVRHIYFLDNGSSDGTVEVAKKFENVTVFRSTLPFKVYQMQMKQYLIERFARDRWSLCVDIDELFDYPYSDVIDLSSLLNYLSERSYTAVLTQMLDMFPEEPLTDAAETSQDEELSLKQLYRFYDIANLHLTDYSSHKGICGPGNTLANEQVSIYMDGIKSVVFPRNNPVLTKHALVFLDERMRPMDGNAHRVSGAKVADISCVLLHYTFTSNLYEAVRRAVQMENYNKDSRKHKMYMRTLAEKPSLQIKTETSREFQDVNDLVHNQFLALSSGYMAMVEKVVSRRFGQVSRDRPHKTMDVLFETRALTGARIREAARLHEQIQKRMRRLESRVERRREGAREAIEKSQVLQRQVQNLQRQVQNLQRQVRDTRVRRPRRLPDWLGYIRARVLGRGSK